MQNQVDTKLTATKNYWTTVISQMANNGLIDTEEQLSLLLSSVIDTLEDFLQPSSVSGICVGSCELRSFRELENIVPKYYLSRDSLPLSSKYEFAQYSIDCLTEQVYDLEIQSISQS